MDRAREIELIGLYNALVALTRDRNRRIITPNLANQERARKLQEFLDEKGLDAEPYLCSCFASHHWTWPPKFGSLIEQRYLNHFDNHPEEARGWWKLAQREIPQEPPKVWQGQEIIKKRFRAEGQELLCSLRLEMTGGWNPASPICVECKESDLCRRSQRRSSRQTN